MVTICSSHKFLFYYQIQIFRSHLLICLSLAVGTADNWRGDYCLWDVARRLSQIWVLIFSPFPFPVRIDTYSTPEDCGLKRDCKVRHWWNILEATLLYFLYCPVSREASFLKLLLAILWQLIKRMMSATLLWCDGEKLRNERGDYVLLI